MGAVAALVGGGDRRLGEPMTQRYFPRTVPGDARPPSLLEFLALHCGYGVALGIVAAAIVVLTDLGGIKELLQDSAEPFVPMLLIFSSFALTFGALKMGIAIMSLPLEAPDEGEDEGKEPPEPLQPRQ